VERHVDGVNEGEESRWYVDACIQAERPLIGLDDASWQWANEVDGMVNLMAKGSI
jgi:hypothetical protein